MSRPRVAVIGAGAAGLAVTKELQDVGAHVVVFSNAHEVGGIWNSGKLYRGLVTNLPKEVMAFPGFDFPEQTRSFLPATEVGKYLVDFADAHKLQQHVRFGTRVVSVEATVAPPLQDALRRALDSSLADASASVASAEGGEGDDIDDSVRWLVTSRLGEEEGTRTESFDAVVVANGHYNVPALPSEEDLPGLRACEEAGLHVMHSQQYDYPDPALFGGKTVVCVGARASGADLGRELAEVAGTVVVVDRQRGASEKCPCNDALWVRPGISQIRVSGSSFSAEFSDGSVVDEVDVVILCTGYHYDFEFLSNFVDIRQRRVHPLYLQLFHRELPSLSFVGLCHSVVPFPLFAAQARAIAAHLTGTWAMPSRRERARHLHEASLAWPRQRDAHYLSGKQWAYVRELEALARSGGTVPSGARWSTMEEVDAVLARSRGMYEDSTARRPAFPAGDDLYRRVNYALLPDGSWTNDAEAVV